MVTYVDSACAAGVSSTFGTAFGATLFSVEFTSFSYAVNNLPRAFLTATCSLLVILTVGGMQQAFGVQPIFPYLNGSSGGEQDPAEHRLLSDIFLGYSAPPTPTHDAVPSYSTMELVHFILIGCIGGFGGTIFVLLVEVVVDVRLIIIVLLFMCSLMFPRN